MANNRSPNSRGEAYSHPMIHLDLFPKWLLPNRTEILEALAQRCLTVTTHHEGRTFIDDGPSAISKPQVRKMGPIPKDDDDDEDEASPIPLKVKTG